MVNTFKILCSLADFSSIKTEYEESKPKEIPEVVKSVKSQKYPKTQPFNVTINIQLTLPENKDDEVYDKFFEALKRHLLTD